MKQFKTYQLVAFCGALLALFVGMFFVSPIHYEPDIVVVSASYNNARWCIKSIQSVVDQTYKKWRMVIINDCSTDGQDQLIENYIAERKLQDKITLINNKERKGALRNFYETIHGLPDSVVVVNLDGDDWFWRTDALEIIATAYKDRSVWMTYGNYKVWPAVDVSVCRPIPAEVMRTNNFRNYPWVSSHPRTFYAWLFKRIRQEDLQLHGEFFSMNADLATMFPMLEMASHGHIRFIPTEIYLYNTDNPINDYKVNAAYQHALYAHIRKMKRYEPL